LADGGHFIFGWMLAPPCAALVIVPSVVLTPLTLVNKGQVNLGSFNPDQSVNGINEVNVMGAQVSASSTDLRNLLFCSKLQTILYGNVYVF